MPLVVEDGTGLVSTANSYVSEAESDTYFEIIPEYGVTWQAYTPSEKECLLRFSTRVLDARTQWEGYKQVDASPRKCVTDRDGVSVLTTVVPQAVKDATCELARILDGEDITTGQDIERLRKLVVDVVEIEYQEGDSQTRVPQYMGYILRGLGAFMSGSMSFNRIRKA